MKSFSIYLATIVSAILLFSCAKNSQNNSETVTASFDISGMTCAYGCARTIEEKLNESEGVLEAKVIFEDNKCSISYDNEAINDKKIADIVESMGGGGKYIVENFKMNRSVKGSDKIKTSPSAESVNGNKIIGQPIFKPVAFPNIFLAIIRGVAGGEI